MMPPASITYSCNAGSILKCRFQRDTIFIPINQSTDSTDLTFT
jgi:hypothetical protein